MLPRYGDKVTTSPVAPPRCTARLPLPALETDQVSLLPEQLFSKTQLLDYQSLWKLLPTKSQ